MIKQFHDGLKHCIATGVYTHSLLLAHEFEPLLMPITSSDNRVCTIEDLIYSNKHNTLYTAMSECLQLFIQDVDDCLTES